MAAVIQIEPRYLEPDPFSPGRSTPRRPPVRHLRSVPDRQPRPRPARRHHRAAVYRRRRLLAALVGLGLVLTVARAGAALGGSSLATPERLPHVQHVVVQPGDSLWSIAQRVAPGHDVRPIVDALAHTRGTTAVAAGEILAVPAP
jgi:hypothetical protein